MNQDLDKIVELLIEVSQQTLFMKDDLAFYELPSDVSTISHEDLVSIFKGLLIRCAYRVEAIEALTNQMFATALNTWMCFGGINEQKHDE